MIQNKDNYRGIVNSESFVQLLRVRNGVRFLLSILVILLHAFFVGGIAFYNEWFAQPLWAGSHIPIGLVITALVIIGMLVLEWAYIHISQNKLNPLQEQVRREVSDEK